MPVRALVCKKTKAVFFNIGHIGSDSLELEKYLLTASTNTSSTY